MRPDIEIILEALDSVSRNASYEVKGPDLMYKLKLEIERIREREEKREERIHKEAINEEVS